MNESKFWLDIAVAEIIAKYPKGEIVLSSGISPSASYHIGHFREILTVEALTWGLKQAGRNAKHIHVVDNFDPLRKRYDFLPEAFEEHVGKPVCLIPDPAGDCHKTYADHFYSEFEFYARKMGIRPEQTIRSYEDLYSTGKMADQIEKVLDNIEAVREIFKTIANRDLEKDWTPVQVLTSTKQFENAQLGTWDKAKKTIGGADYSKGEAKLNWRLDWPARWQVLGVQVEPFGRELASAGSAHATGVEFAKQVYGFEPPIAAAQYEPIHLVGDAKKMSSSLGNLVTPHEALEIMPPEVLRYFVTRSRPDRKLHFDPGVGLYNLIDEFSQIEDQPDHEFKDAYQFAAAIKDKQAERTISSVSFKHLVSVYQAAQKDPKEVLEILARTGYEKQVGDEKEVIQKELEFIDNWLDKYAPEEVRFSVQDELPKVELSKEQKGFLTDLADTVEGTKELDAQAVHDTIYKLTEKYKLQPGEAFKAIYRVILGKDSGPKAGWFLTNLDKAWLVKRLRLKS